MKYVIRGRGRAIVGAEEGGRTPTGIAAQRCLRPSYPPAHAYSPPLVRRHGASPRTTARHHIGSPDVSPATARARGCLKHKYVMLDCRDGKDFWGCVNCGQKWVFRCVHTAATSAAGLPTGLRTCWRNEVVTPMWTDSSGLVDLYAGDVLDVLRYLPAASVQCVVTSPPYFALRDYGTATWEGGDPACDHVAGLAHNDSKQENRTSPTLTGGGLGRGGTIQFAGECGKCGATRIDQQIGLEATPEEYITKMVEVFRAVKRVLRDDGTLWLNCGDSYAGSQKGYMGNGEWADRSGVKQGTNVGALNLPPTKAKDIGLKPKDLIGMPWMLAFALRADGWYLRSDIIWHKPNPMPESVTDRPTKAHEYVFLLTKRAHYYYDAEAVRESYNSAPTVEIRTEVAPKGMGSLTPHSGPIGRGGSHATAEHYQHAGRNRRTVWTISTESYEGAHFATFPQKLVEPCILAGTSERGCCPACGAPWVRVTDISYTEAGRGNNNGARKNGSAADAGAARPYEVRKLKDVTTLGWRQSCACPPAEPVPCVVLDCFVGSGTTAMVAKRLMRRAVGIDLNAEYLKLAQKRVRSVEPGVQLELVEG